MEVEIRNWCHCVRFVITRLLVCSLTYLSHVDLDLDLRLNFECDLTRSRLVCFEPSRREKHDGVEFTVVSFLCKTL